MECNTYNILLQYSTGIQYTQESNQLLHELKLQQVWFMCNVNSHMKNLTTVWYAQNWLE